MSRTQETKLEYKSKGLWLWQRAEKKARSTTAAMSATYFAQFLFTLLPNLRQSTRRTYLAYAREQIDALIAEQSQSSNPANLQNLLTAKNTLYSINARDFNNDHNSRRQLPRRTSSHKAKSLNNKNHKALLESLKARKTPRKYDLSALTMLTAGLMVGLRPSEWRFAQLSTEYLIVKNAKHTNNRGNGNERNINISSLPPQELNVLKLQLRIVGEYSTTSESWKKFMQGCQQAIHRMTRESLGELQRYPSLYTGRHQFSANAKSSGLSKAELAALMGHASDVTATHHYGKKKDGNMRLKVTPKPEEVATVRTRSIRPLRKGPRLR